MRRSVLLLSLLFSISFLKAQDTLRVTLQGADSLFYKNNFLLIAAQYNVDGQDALVKQARLWENPVFSTSLNAFNSDHQNFNVGPTGEKAFELDQLIYLGGKKKNEIQLAKQDKALAEIQLDDLSRNLVFQIKCSFFAILYTQSTLASYQSQISLLDELLKEYTVQVDKGNIPLKEQLRLEAALYSLKNEKNTLQNDILEQQNNLKTLLGVKSYIQPIGTSLEEVSKRAVPAMDSLVKIAIANRPDVKIAEETLTWNQVNYKLQKSLAIPDLTIGANYDQHGSAFPNQTSLTLSMPLPLLNRNQGNIRFAEAQVKSAEATQKNSEIMVSNEVSSVYTKLLQAKKDYNSIDHSYLHEFETLNKGLVTNFQKQNISLIEFVDLFESYNSSLREINDLTVKFTQSYEELNYVCGKKVW